LQRKIENTHMKTRMLLFAALLCCIANVQLKADETLLYESNGIHYVLTERVFPDATTRTAYVVHPQTTLDDGAPTPTTPSSYSGQIVIEETIIYDGKDFPVKFIDENAFLQSTITSIDLPSTIMVFGTAAFKDCQQLQTIICRSTRPTTTRIYSVDWGYEDVFGSVDPDQVSVYVPEVAITTYQVTGGWDEFTHYYSIESKEDIDQVSEDAPGTRKIIYNGKVYILREGHSYTLTGSEIK